MILQEKDSSRRLTLLLAASWLNMWASLSMKKKRIVENGYILMNTVVLSIGLQVMKERSGEQTVNSFMKV